MTGGFQEFRVSNDAIDDPEELRRRIDAEGYLFFRSLQDPDKLGALRQDVLRVCREGGWLKDGTELRDGIAETAHRCTEGDLEYAQVYHENYKLESFRRICDTTGGISICECCPGTRAGSPRYLMKRCRWPAAAIRRRGIT